MPDPLIPLNLFGGLKRLDVTGNITDITSDTGVRHGHCASLPRSNDCCVFPYTY